MQNPTPMLQHIRRHPQTRRLCLMMSFLLVAQLILPVVSFGLTSGPVQPEFTSFEPVVTTDLVNDFSGNFTYNLPVLNIPGPDGGGYALSLSYHSGSSSEEEASWVGFGWNINPGTINRQARGYPDDFKDTPIIKYNKTKPNWTQSSTASFNLEINSKDEDPKPEGEGKAKSMGLFEIRLGPKPSTPAAPDNSDQDTENYESLFSFSASKAVRFNNYSGFSISNSFGAGYKGMGSLNMTRAGGENTYAASINPVAMLSRVKEKNKDDIKFKKAYGLLMKAKKQAQQYTELRKKVDQKTNINLPTAYNIQSYNAPALPYSINYSLGRSYNYSASIQFNPAGPIGFQVGLAGNFNTQIPAPETEVFASGYMYQPDYSGFSPMVDKAFHDLGSTKIREGDFSIERATTFNKHDRHLGIPYNNADLLTATGNAIMGGFRFHHQTIGTNYPSLVTTKDEIRQAGVEFGFFQTMQVGIDVGIGLHKTKMDRWNNRSSNPVEYTGDAPFLHFTNDRGGTLRYSKHDSLQYATIGSLRKLELDSIAAHNDLQTDEFGQSSTINYATFNASGQLGSPLDLGNSTITGEPDQVGQIAITNKDGSHNYYGVPVYTKGQTELSVGLDQFADGDYLSYQTLKYTDPLENRIVAGQCIASPYATTFLLTQTTTFDYVDVNNNGADEADFGGWTRFNYRKVYGHTATDWYRYRAPYTGLLYERGRLMDLKDQTGSVSSGYKEVYYLQYIETKSHIAFFVTNKTQASDLEVILENAAGVSIPDGQLDDYLQGSQDDRLDCYDAAAIDANGEDPAAVDPTARGTNQLEKLERIILIAKSDWENPISVTHFAYDYSLCREIPNGINNSGKLTLKQVWTESGGTIRSRISPYRFFYNYFQDYPASVMSTYPNLLSRSNGDDYYENLQSADENPVYDPTLLDMWGNYRPGGSDRFENMQPWVDQRIPLANYDPAAWQLKRIVLPSGGEIHVQYEEHDYRYVQDLNATGMVPLQPTSNERNGYKSGDDASSNRYYVDLGAIGLTAAEAPVYASWLNTYFREKNNKLYFKVLYALKGSVPADLVSNPAALERSEYISGHTIVDTVGVDGGGLYLQLGETKQNGNGQNDKTLPRWVCLQQLLTSGGYNLHRAPQQWKTVDEEITAAAHGDFNNDGTLDILQSSEKNKVFREVKSGQVVPGTFRLFEDWSSINNAYLQPKLQGVPKQNACQELNHELSYFKLPLPKPKRGGGARVKRLISYDPGIETGAAMVYGSQYMYQTENGESSGVATNEPPAGREENAIIGFIERNKQRTINKLLNGRITETMEGTLGEQLYPGATVNYGRVVITNLHQGASTTGYQVNEYYTVKDYPSVEVEHTEISRDNDTYRKLNFSLPLGLLNFSRQWASVTQGYLFRLNDMHGKPKRQTTYPGPYLTGVNPPLSSQTEYHYSEPGDKVQTLVYDPGLDSLQTAYLNPGTEEDLTIFESSVNDRTLDLSVELDLNIVVAPPITLGISPSVSYQDQQLNQHVTTKVLNQQSYLLATTSTADGVVQTTTHLAFDKYTGDPVLTMTYDGYYRPGRSIYTNANPGQQHEGKYYQLNFPASWVYTEMGPDNSLTPTGNRNQLSAFAGSISTYGNNPIETYWSEGLFKDVVSASATVYSKEWFDGLGDHALADQDFVLPAAQIPALNEHYYPYRTYVYRDSVGDANSDDYSLYNGGLIAQLTPFDWQLTNYRDSLLAGHWFSASRVLAYSPHGYPLAEEDVLGLRSVAKFGYDKQLPVLVAQNADYATAHFLDFEYPYPQINSAYLVTGAAHTGRFSFSLSQHPTQVFVANIPLDEQLNNAGASLKFWLSSTLSNDPLNPNYGLQNSTPNLQAVINSQLYPCVKVAQTGAWSLYEVRIRNWYGTPIGSLLDVRLMYDFQPNETVLVDDLRFQPLDAVMNCTVYRPDFRVAAQFDDQHFAVFYEYDTRGNLVRKSIETERGRKTLQEQQYNTPEIARYYD